MYDVMPVQVRYKCHPGSLEAKELSSLNFAEKISHFGLGGQDFL